MDPQLTDRAWGMLLGHMVGDALGMPHEFTRKKNQGLDSYSGSIITTTFHNQYHGPRTTALGQGSDDTEMMLTLLNSLAIHPNYDPGATALMYMEFANNSSFIGKNTRRLLRGVKTLAGYSARYQAAFGSASPAEITQSNGFLMRAAPLALLPDSRRRGAALEDAALTNPGPYNAAMQLVYVELLRTLLVRQQAASPLAPEAAAALVNCAAAEYPEAQGVLAPLLGYDLGDCRGPNKGWARIALHVAILAATDPSITSYAQGVQRVVSLGGDTDTNAAIAGAALGARFGLSEMLRCPITASNVLLVLNCDTRTGDYGRGAMQSATTIVGAMFQMRYLMPQGPLAPPQNDRYRGGGEDPDRGLAQALREPAHGGRGQAPPEEAPELPPQ